MKNLAKYRIFACIVAAVMLLGVLSACDSDDGKKDGQTKESSSQQSNYDKLVSQDPAHSMAVSQTRKNINKWIDTWGKDPNKLSYVYFQNTQGDLINYFVFKGLPVSYCTSLTPNYKIIKPEITGDNNVALSVPAPSVDGVYYSGGECNRYYGFDANTGAFVEYNVGQGINVLLYDAPLPNKNNVPKLTPAK